MARPQSHTRDEFVRAALAIVDAEGLEALTFRRLGAEMDVSYTAAYTYFENREALVSAIVNSLVSDMGRELTGAGSTPREIFMGIGLAVRKVLTRHPQVVSAFVTVDAGASEFETGIMETAIALLDGAGLRGDELVLAYRTLETYILGAVIFDFGGAPNHLSIRRRRYKGLKREEFLPMSRSDKAMAAHNDEAFVLGLERLLISFGL